MENEFDVIVLGTGLSESITAAALAKTGLKVAHIDPNVYYGADEATLTLDELVQWADAHTTSDLTQEHSQSIQYCVEYRSPDILPHSKQYSISLSPSIIPSVGPFISSLISSGVARYGSFKLLGPVSVYHHGQFKGVPQNKDSIFRDRTIPLIEKRRLMRFLIFASGEFENSSDLQGKESVPFDQFLCQSFSLGEDIARVITFALAYCDFYGETTLAALRRVRSCLRSTGRYGSSPFLVGYYGGSGEISQGFCRAAAVNGSVYILGRKISNIAVDELSSPGSHDQGTVPRYTVEIDGIPGPLRSSCLLSSPSHVPDCLRFQAGPASSDANAPSTSRHQVPAVARCIAIVDGSVILPHLNGSDDAPLGEGESDSFLVVFPPGSLNHGSMTSSVHVLTAGAGTMSAPSDKSMIFCTSINVYLYLSHFCGTGILYLSMPLHECGRSSKDLLHPYLTAILAGSAPLFQVFYTQNFPPAYDSSFLGVRPHFYVLPVLHPDIPQSVDHAAQHAESAFWYIMKALNPNFITEGVKGIWVNNDLADANNTDDWDW
ncbi:FAD/NAD(P)-binding domain-containing protein [Gyrodon lividus]|nr:FAD/NAD(P)-binding domain-containing protein [Gyrodon lividus]